MLIYLAWTFGVLLTLACGWFAGAWVHQRRIEQLQVQIKVLRQTATVHADQARRQIGQLQADLAGRPHPGQPRPPADVQTACAQSASAQAASAQLRPRRRAGVDQKFLHQDDGFAHTAIVGAEGFAPTQLLR